MTARSHVEQVRAVVCVCVRVAPSACTCLAYVVLLGYLLLLRFDDIRHCGRVAGDGHCNGCYIWDDILILIMIVGLLRTGWVGEAGLKERLRPE